MTFILAILSLMAVITIVYVTYQMRDNFRTRWFKISDTDTPAATFRFFDGDDILQVFSCSKGYSIKFVCINHTSAVTSTRFLIGSNYDSPHDFIMSGNIDEEIRDLRMLAEAELLSSKDGYKYSGTRLMWSNSIDRVSIVFKPISFDDFKTLLLS